ncbi:MAG: DUF3048 domain-containing protein, partial [Acidimicrobiaceae bacterium]
MARRHSETWCCTSPQFGSSPTRPPRHRSDRPHYNLNQADLFYVEEVEWGLTRIAAMYNTKFPSVVGPTRSARISDLELLEQFTNPGLAYSGANDVLL